MSRERHTTQRGLDDTGGGTERIELAEVDQHLRPVTPEHHGDAGTSLLHQASSESSKPTSDTWTEHPGRPLRRYYWRGLVGCLGPVLITIYFLITWRLYLDPPVSPDGTIFGRSGANLVFYSWFFIAVVGLDIGEYGMVGVEATMLMRYFWAAPDAMHIMMHGEHTWSGIGGWMSTLRRLLVRHDYAGAPTRLWTVLATVSLFLFTGLPLIGLTMEVNDGFLPSQTHPQLVGQRWETFNQRNSPASSSAVFYGWSLAVPPRVPAWGVIYANQSADKTKLNSTNLNKLPNVVPTDEGVDELFLAPQADTPVSGKLWGLMVRYNCTIIEKKEDFVILSQRKPFALNASALISYKINPNQVIEIRNRTVRNDFDESFINYRAVSELGYSTEAYGDPFWASQNPTQCYFNKSDHPTRGYPGLEYDSILELALWQYGTDNESLIYPPLPASFYNLSLGTTVAGLNGAHSIPNENVTLNTTIPLSAIGVQCKSSSALGFADVDGPTSSYTNFQKTDTPIVNPVSACPLRLSVTVPQILFLPPFDQSTAASDLWAENFFTSAEAPATFRWSESDDPVVFVTVRPTLLQASELRRSLLRAYGTTAVQLIYNGGQGYSFADSGQTYQFQNPNATAFRPARVLSPGPIPPVVPAVLMSLWCIGSCFLAARYGFVRRWAEMLDSFSLFRFGADLGDKVRDNPAFAVEDVDDCEELRRLPGLIGDSRPYSNPGHVTLVDAAAVEHGKNYL